MLNTRLAFVAERVKTEYGLFVHFRHSELIWVRAGVASTVSYAWGTCHTWLAWLDIWRIWRTRITFRLFTGGVSALASSLPNFNLHMPAIVPSRSASLPHLDRYNSQLDVQGLRYNHAALCISTRLVGGRRAREPKDPMGRKSRNVARNYHCWTSAGCKPEQMPALNWVRVDLSQSETTSFWSKCSSTTSDKATRLAA